MAAPSGAPARRLNVMFCGGQSLSVAVAVNASKVPSSMILSAMGATSGGKLGPASARTLKAAISTPVTSPIEPPVYVFNATPSGLTRTSP